MVNKTPPPEPENIQFSELNPGFNRSPRPNINKSELDRRARDNHLRPDVTKEIPGPLLAIAVETGRMENPADFLIGDSLAKFGNSQPLMVVRARIVEQHRFSHPEQGLKYADDTTDIDPKDMLVMFDEFVAIDEKITDTPQPGDFVLVDYENRLTMTGPKYYGLKYRGSKTSGAKKDKIASQPGANNTSLANNVAPPTSGGGSPVPATPVGNPTAPPTALADGRLDCGPLFQLNRTPGLQPTTFGGPARPIEEYEQVEMVIIPTTGVILFPKKYIRAIDALLQAFEQEKGYKLGINSGFRRVDLQRCMYQDYLAKKRNLLREGKVAQAQRVAPVGDPDLTRGPGAPVHIAGTAIDFNTGYDPTSRNTNRNSEFTEFYIKNKELRNKDKAEFGRQSFNKTIAGEFGPSAQWLVQNSERFGFRWSGWKFQELWHYDFDIGLGRSLGYVDE